MLLLLFFHVQTYSVSMSEIGAASDVVGDTIFDGPLVSEVGSASDSSSATAIFGDFRTSYFPMLALSTVMTTLVAEPGGAADSATITGYIQAPLPAPPQSMRRALRIR